MSDSLGLRSMRQVDGKRDCVIDDLGDIKVRVTNIEENLAALNRRVDRMDLRMERIERRLDQAETGYRRTQAAVWSRRPVCQPDQKGQPTAPVEDLRRSAGTANNPGKVLLLETILLHVELDRIDIGTILLLVCDARRRPTRGRANATQGVGQRLPQPRSASRCSGAAPSYKARSGVGRH